jgi:hypothetical protein
MVSVFKMKEVINGPKKGNQVPTAIKDPNDGELIVSNEEIKKVTLAYCVDNLTKQHKDESVIKALELKKVMHNIRMKEQEDEEFDVGSEDFEVVLDKFASKSTKRYDVLLKAGKDYQESVFRLCKQMILREEFPSTFQKKILNMIWKQKGPAEILSNSRFILTKETFWPRICEAVTVNKMRETIEDSQGMPPAPEEHIFTIKSLWPRLDMEGSGMILTLVDIIAFFDRKNIHDIGVNKKAARVWFKLNKDTEVAVKTAGGMSETAHVGDCIGRGTACSALVSQANLDHVYRVWIQ